MEAVDVTLVMNKIHTRALWHFYKSLLPFILAFTLLCNLVFGSLPALILFFTIAIFIGFFAFSLFKKQEFYFYYNIGYTKWKLFKVVFVINILVGGPIVLTILTLITLIFGDIKLI
jgi:hypothetical protein